MLNQNLKSSPPALEFQGGLACHPPGSVLDKGPHNQVEHAPQGLFTSDAGKALGGKNPRGAALCRYFLMHPHDCPQDWCSNLHPPREKPSRQETGGPGPGSGLSTCGGGGLAAAHIDHTLSGVPDLETSLEAARDRKQN